MSVIPMRSGNFHQHRSAADGSPSRCLSICVVGLGYIGLPTAAVLAARGHRVHGVDVRLDVVETINAGRIHIHEPHLDELVQRVVADRRLTASLEPCQADVFFLCVPTPVAADRSPDLTYVEAAARAIRPFVGPGNLIILESTSPPGTTQRAVVAEAIPPQFGVGRDVFVAYCPERVLPGHILEEVIHNDRIVGGVTPACTDRARAFYETFVQGNVLPTTAVTAEMAKLVENSYRDVNIAFANELSMLAEGMGVDPFEVIQLANRHPRVDILTPGPGVGGHCISVDPWFLVHASPESTPLIATARRVNDSKPGYVTDKIEQLARHSGASTIGCLGLAYKPDVDDLRESPSLEIVRDLKSRQLGEVLVCEPYVDASRFTEFPLASLDETLRRSEVVVLLTDHREFREIPAAQLQGKTLVDTRGTWRPLLDQIATAESTTAARAAA